MKMSNKKIILPIIILLLSIIFMIGAVSATTSDSDDKLSNNNVNNKISHTASINGENISTNTIAGTSKNKKTNTTNDLKKIKSTKSGNTVKNVKTPKNSILSNDGYLNTTDAFNYLNEFRTTQGVWYWANDDKTKVYFNTNKTNQLQKLIWDADLEKTAKIRAKEISKSFSHTRPDGTTCFTAYPDNLWACGENIAMGYTSSKSVTEAWKEDNDNYNGQGHRRNMLYSSFNCVGIAGYRVNGIIYWVQSFGKKDNIQEDTNYDDYTDNYTDDYDDEYEPVHDAYIQSKKIQYNTKNNITITWKGNLEGYFKLYKGKKQIYTHYLKGYNKKYTYKIKGLNVGNYTTKIIYNSKTIAKGKIIIKKATPQLTAKTKNKKYTITLKNNQKKAMNNQTITLKIKNKTYKKYTNKKGQVTFKITNLNKKGNYTATITYKGNKNYKKVTKKVKIIIK